MLAQHLQPIHLALVRFVESNPSFFILLVILFSSMAKIARSSLRLLLIPDCNNGDVVVEIRSQVVILVNFNFVDGEFHLVAVRNI